MLLNDWAWRRNSEANLNRASYAINGREIAVTKGVKQGDHISPILFNAVLDEIVCRPQNFSRIDVNNSRIRCLAYADDLALFARSRVDSERMVEAVREFLCSRGMNIKAAKSAMLCFRTVPNKKKVAVDETPLKCGTEYIRAASLFIQLRRLKRAPLKPHQKMRILKDFLIPRVIACMQQPSITKKVLKEADCKIRVFIRNTLHLNIHCHNPVIYAAVRDGGLGIFCLHEQIPGIVLQRINKLRERNELFAALIQADNSLLVRIENLTSPISNKAANREHHAAALNASFSGCNGLKQLANNKLSRLYDPPPFWPGEDYVKPV